MSQDGCFTTWHTDFSGTSVCYILLKGVKIFYICRPSEQNLRIFDAYLEREDRKVFFGDHPGLDDGGCQKVTLTAGQAVVMPANFIHMVETQGFAVAYGQNFLHVGQLWQAASHYELERSTPEDYSKCYPEVPVLVLTLMAQLM